MRSKEHIARLARENYALRKLKAEKMLADVRADPEAIEKLRWRESDTEKLEELIQNPGRHALVQLGTLKFKAQVTRMMKEEEGSSEGVTVTVRMTKPVTTVTAGVRVEGEDG